MASHQRRSFHKLHWSTTWRLLYWSSVYGEIIYLSEFNMRHLAANTSSPKVRELRKTNIFRENGVWARKRSFPSFLFGLWRPCICVDFNFRNQKTKSEYNETTWNNISKHEYWYIFKPAWPHSWNCVLLRCCRKYCILYPKRVYGGGG